MRLVQLVVSAEEQVQSGHLEATVESEHANDSSSSITFDLGGATRSPRMHFVSSYRSEAGQRITELIMIGDTSWERIDGREWVEVAAREGVWGQVQGFLPGVAAFAETGQIRVEDNRLTWSDTVRDIDVTLQVDVATGVPQQLRRASRSTNSVVTVTYSGWNAPVDIQAPSSP
jgi:hypothetical protein